MTLPKDKALTNKNDDDNSNDKNSNKNALKKKNTNTLFAQKMRIKKKEERRLKKNINHENGTGTNSCKSLLVNVTRISKNPVSKNSLSLENWKKKKNIVEKVVDSINSNDDDIQDKDNKELEKNVQSSSLELIDSTSECKEKMQIETDKRTVECLGSFCRRTLPFVGKLNSKAARAAHVKYVLRNICGEEENNQPSSLNQSRKNDENLVSNDTVKSVESYGCSRTVPFKSNHDPSTKNRILERPTSSNAITNVTDQNLVTKNKETSSTITSLDKVETKDSEKVQTNTLEQIDVRLDKISTLQRKKQEASSSKDDEMESESKSNSFAVEVSDAPLVNINSVSSTCNDNDKVDTDNNVDDSDETNDSSTSNNQEICSRTVPRLYLFFRNCSRTMPFPQIVQQVKNLGVSKSNISTGSMDESATVSDLKAKEKSLLVSSTVKNNKSKEKRRHHMLSDTDSQSEEESVKKKSRIKSPMKVARKKSGPASSKLLSTSNSTSLSNAASLKLLKVKLTKLEYMKDPLVLKFFMKCKNTTDLQSSQEKKNQTVEKISTNAEINCHEVEEDSMIYFKTKRKRIINCIMSDSEDDNNVSLEQLMSSKLSSVEGDEDDMEVAELTRQASQENNLNSSNPKPKIISDVRLTRAQSRAAGIIVKNTQIETPSTKVKKLKPKSIIEKKVSPIFHVNASNEKENNEETCKNELVVKDESALSDKDTRLRSANVTPMTTPLKDKTSLSKSVEKVFKSVAPFHDQFLSKALKVQLIKLENICADYKEHSASEIEVLTDKYINSLMNSNFACKWLTPPYFYRPSCNRVNNKLIDNFNCVSTPSSQDYIQGIVEVTKDIDDYNYQEINDNVNNTTLSKSPKIKVMTPKKSNHPVPINLLSLSPRLGDTIESTTVKTNNINTTTESCDNVQEEALFAEKQKHIDDNDNKKQDDDLKEKDTVIETFVCKLCDEVFSNETNLLEHDKQSHQLNNENPTESNENSDVTSLQNEKIISKKSHKAKKKMMRSSNSTECSVCKKNFDSKDDLWDHLKKHSEAELQQAYKVLSKGLNVDQSLTENLNINDKESQDKEKEQENRENTQILNNNQSNEIEEIIIDASNVELDGESMALNTAGPSNLQMNFTTVESPVVVNKVLTICPCHANETSGQGLQIEMVLLCKSCKVIFRRLQCFETHYRASPECSKKRELNQMTKLPKLLCSGCPCILDTLLEMRTHLEMHAEQNRQGTVIFLCNICKVAFFGVGGIFYSHWFNHVKTPDFVASKLSFPKLSVVSVLDDSKMTMPQNKSQEGFFYIAEHVCRQCKSPFSSEPDLQLHKATPCKAVNNVNSTTASSIEVSEKNTQMIKLICDLCKKYYVSKENFDEHCMDRNHLKTPNMKYSRVPVSETEQAIVCSLCRAMSKALPEMKEHWKCVHSPIMELYTCKSCNVVPSNDVTNYTYDKFILHCRSTHKSEVINCLVYFVTARYVCSICKFGFDSEKSMKEHETVHEKTSVPSLIVNTVTLNNGNINHLATPILSAQATTLWYADKNIAPDGGRQVLPIYLQYPTINGTLNIPTVQNKGISGSQNLQQQLPILSQNLNLTLNNSGGYATVASTANINHHLTNSNNRPINNLQHNLLDANVLIQQQLMQQKTAITTNRASSPETILLDSRSNSPVTNVNSSSIRLENESTTNVTNDKSAATASRKSYMTIVNPDFESILGSNDDQSINNKSDSRSHSDKNKNTTADSAIVCNDSTEKNTPEVVTTPPQPFEIVLVNDEIGNDTFDDDQQLNHLDNEKKSTKKQVAATTSDSSNDGSFSTRTFLRVRSVAELQQIKIHLCSVCNLSFDTFNAFNQHQRIHDKDANLPITPAMDMESDTPVRMIMPMSNNKESFNESILTSEQARQNTYSLSNLMPLSNNSIEKTNSSSITSNQLQQSQQYWFNETDRSENSFQQSAYNTSINYVNLNRPQQMSLLRHQILPQTANSVIPTMNYSTRGPLPSHPNAAPSAMSPNRTTAAIQLPERNAVSSGMPASKRRPSGAATIMPKQNMLPSYDSIMDQRQSGVRVPLNLNENLASSSNNNNLLSIPRLNSNMGSRTPQQQQQQQQNQYLGKSYGRLPNELIRPNSYNTLINYNTQPQHQMQQQQQQQQLQKVFSCKYQNCKFRTESYGVLRTHEKIHTSNQLSSVNQSVNQLIQKQHQYIQQQQQQQQRLPAKHVSVCQMPERTRHAMPSSRTINTNAQNHDKRAICRLCNIYFSSSVELGDHNATVHSSIQTCCYVCDYCAEPQIFDSEILLREHMDIKHNYSCEPCKKRYPTKENLQSHMRETHAKT